MKLEQQVVSLGLAKKLKELGVKQKGVWSWVLTDEERWELAIHSRGYTHHTNSIKVPDYGYTGDGSYGWRNIEDQCVAFTVAELGEMLPKWSKSFQREEEWEADCRSHAPLIYSLGDTEADARAKMLIYLIENNLIQNNA